MSAPIEPSTYPGGGCSVAQGKARGFEGGGAVGGEYTTVKHDFVFRSGVYCYLCLWDFCSCLLCGCVVCDWYIVVLDYLCCVYGLGNLGKLSYSYNFVCFFGFCVLNFVDF